jgi:hypothetical protein
MKFDNRKNVFVATVCFKVEKIDSEHGAYITITDITPDTDPRLKGKQLWIPTWVPYATVCFGKKDNVIEYRLHPKKVGLECGDVMHARITHNERHEWFNVSSVVEDSIYQNLVGQVRDRDKKQGNSVKSP